MKKDGHISVFELILTARSPVHIGSGSICAKTDYLFDPRTGMVSMIDPDALFAWLFKKRLADRYEAFVLSGDTRLYHFLKDNGISNSELNELCLYKVSSADALDASRSLKEIHTFIRDSRHRAYIPGSSVKGALRTVILTAMIAKEKKGAWPIAADKSEKTRQMQDLEGRYLNTLSLKRDRNGNLVNDPVNSILRGLSVSDSEPISDRNLILVGKIDADERGECRKRSLCRECIRPGTELRFKLTLDHSALPMDDFADDLMQMIREYDEYYQKMYLSRFMLPRNTCRVSYQNSLILGGGAGFFSKTLTYPYLGAREGMRYTENFMRGKFRGHHHEKDVLEHGVSPHTMKYGQFDGQLYPYGVCEVKIV